MPGLFPELEEQEASSDLFPELSGGKGETLFPELESNYSKVKSAVKSGANSILGAFKSLTEKREETPFDPIIKDLGISEGVRLGREQLTQLVGPKAERYISGIASGATAMGEGFGGLAKMAGLESFGESLSKVSETVTKGLQPPDPKFADQVAQGFGSMAVFMVPGFGVQAGAARLAAFAPRLASWLGASTAAVLEASVEAGTTYNQSLKKNPEDKDLALQRADAVFWGNLPVLVATDKLGIFGESGKALRKAFASSLLEGTQEASQELLGNLAMQDPIIKETILNAGLVGAIVGGGVGGAVGLMERQPGAAPTPPAAPAPIAPVVPGDAGPQMTSPVPPGVNLQPNAAISPQTTAIQAPVAAPQVSPVTVAAPAEVVPQATEVAQVAPEVSESAEEVRPFEVPGTEIGDKAVLEDIRGLREKGELDPGQEAFASKLEQFWADNPYAKTGVVRQDGSIQPVVEPEKAEAAAAAPTPGEMSTAAKLEEPGPRNISAMTQEEFSNRFPNAPLEAHRTAVRARVMANKDIPDAVAKQYSDILDEVRNSPEPKSSKTPILDEVRKQGGIDLAAVKQGGYKGELENVRRLNVLRKKGGRTIDQLTESLSAAGLIPENSPNALFDALDAEARGGSMVGEEATAYPDESGVKRLREVVKPESAREQVFHHLGRELATVTPLKVMDAAMLSTLKNDKIRQIVVEAIPVDVVNILSKNGFSSNELLSKPDVVGKALSVNDRSTVARGFASALRLVGTRLRTALDGALSAETAGSDSELLPAIRASDLNTREVVGLLAPSRIYGLNGEMSLSGSGGTKSRTKLSVAYTKNAGESGEPSPTELAEKLNRHSQIISSRTGDNPTVFDLSEEVFDRMREDYVTRKPGQLSQEGRSSIENDRASGEGKASSKPSSEVSFSSEESIAPDGEIVKEQIEFNFEQKQSLDAASKDIEKAGKQAAPKFNPKQIDRELRKRGFIDFRGQKVENPRQAAEIAAAFRHPKLEHFQAIFLKNKVVVAHQVITSGLPNAAVIHGDLKRRFMDAAKRLGADQIYLAHNHPSGDPSPSIEDLDATKDMARQMGDIIAGQVVTNGKRFSFIRPDGLHQSLEYSPKVDYRPTKGRILNAEEALAVTAKEFSGHKGYGVIFTDSRRNIIAIEHLKPSGNLKEFVKNRQNHYGAYGVVLAGDVTLVDKIKDRIPGLYEVISFGTRTVSWASERPGRLERFSEKSPFDPRGGARIKRLERNIMSGQMGSSRVQEAPLQYGPDDFDALVIQNKIKPGQEYTLRQAIIDPGVEGGRIPRGRKVKIVDMDREGGQFLIEYRAEGTMEGMGSFTTATPQDFVETYRQPEKPAPKSAVGKRVKEVTGVTKESPQVSMDEAQALKMKLSAMEKGSKVGAREATRKTKATLMEQFKSTLSDMADAKWLTVKYIKDNLPATVRGKFLTMATRAATRKDLARAFIRVDHEVSALYKKSLVSDIRIMAERALDSGGVAVEYKRKIKELLSGVELRSHSAASAAKLNGLREYIRQQAAIGEKVDLPQTLLDRLAILARKPLSSISEHELEWMLEDLQSMVALGKTTQRVREELWQLRKERILREVIPAAVPIEKTIKVDALPGQVLEFKQRLGNNIAKATDFAQDIDLAIMPMDVAFDLLDGVKNYTGPNYVHFKKRLDVSFGRYLDRRDDLVKPIRDLVNRLKLTDSNFDRIGVHAIRVQKGGVEHLMARGLTKAHIDSVKLSPSEQRVYDEMRKVMESQFPEVQKTIASLYNRDIGKVENYFSFHTDYDALSDVDIVRRFGDSNIRDRLTKTEEQGYTKSRAEGARQAIKIHAMDIFEKHIDDVAYLIETQSDVKMLFEVANSQEYGQAVGQVGQRFVMEWMDLMARKGGADGAKRIARLDTLRRNYGAAALGLRLSSIFIQPTSLLDGAALIGGRYVANGLTDIATSKQWREFLLKNFPELRNRIGDDAAYSDLSMEKWLKNLQRVGFAGLQWMDALSASAVTAGAYRKVLDQMGLPLNLDNPQPEAVQLATLLLRRTQASPLFKDLSLAISRGGLTGNRSVDKALLQFKTFMLNRWSLIEHDLYRAGIKKGKSVDAAWTASYLVMAALAETGIRRGTSHALGSVIAGIGLAANVPEDRDTFMKDFWVNILGMVPFVSDVIHMAFYESSPIPLLTPITDLPKSVYRASTAKTDQGAIKAAVKAIESLAGMTGIPGVGQAAQLVRMGLSGRTLPFPFRSELTELRSLSKKGGLTNDERIRLHKLVNAESRFKVFNEKFKSAMRRGDMEAAKKAAEAAHEAMEQFR